MPMEPPNVSCQEEIDRIMATDLPDHEKIAQTFDCITRFIIASAASDIEVARAMHDREGLVKTQIKMETIKHARVIYEGCYQRVTGQRPWSGDMGERDDA
jgi:hypothetical protein